MVRRACLPASSVVTLAAPDPDCACAVSDEASYEVVAAGVKLIVGCVRTYPALMTVLTNCESVSSISVDTESSWYDWLWYD